MNRTAPRLGLTLLALLALGGCAARGSDTRAMGGSKASCHAAGAESVLGQKADEHVVEQALALSGGLRTRVIRPSSPLGVPADPMRLNIEVDDTGRIRRMVCG
jgi:hypothetical protein